MIPFGAAMPAATRIDAFAGESRALLGAVMDAALDCIIMADETGRIIACNAMAERSFGWVSRAAIGRSMSDLIVPPQYRAAHEAGMARYLAGGTPRVLNRRLELEAMRADGSLFPVELTITEVQRGPHRRFVAYLRDLTEHRAQAAEIARQHEALHQQEKLAALGSLLAGVAHELNNPLSIVVGHAAMLKEMPAAPQVRVRAEKIERAAVRCTRIVRSFLDLARQRPPARVAFALEGALERTLDLLGYGLTSSGIQVERRIPADLPPVMGDPDQLHQVFANLIVNAQHAMESQEGPRTLHPAVSLGECGQRLEVTIADSGPGVPAEIRHRIFEPFFTTKPVGTGTGIGLAVCRGIIQAHGGSIRLAEPAPQPGGPGGARFVILLPVAQIGGAVHTADADAAGAPQPEPQPHSCALIVDDEADIAELLGEILSADGWRCVVAESGRRAREVLQDRDFDLVMTDLRMPDLDGRALFTWLEQAHPERAARTVFITGDALSPANQVFLARHRRPVLEKPLAPHAVRRTTRPFQARRAPATGPGT